MKIKWKKETVRIKEKSVLPKFIGVSYLKARM